MDPRYDSYFMDVAVRTGGLSYAERAKVGAVAVRNRRIICVGFNGTPPGHPNICEDGDFKTLPSVIHAEDNLVRFAKMWEIDLSGCSIYITHSPCLNCAKIILSAGFSEVIYLDAYRVSEGREFLTSKGIKVRQYQNA